MGPSPLRARMMATASSSVLVRGASWVAVELSATMLSSPRVVNRCARHPIVDTSFLAGCGGDAGFFGFSAAVHPKHRMAPTVDLRFGWVVFLVNKLVDDVQDIVHHARVVSSPQVRHFPVFLLSVGNFRYLGKCPDIFKLLFVLLRWSAGLFST